MSQKLPFILVSLYLILVLLSVGLIFIGEGPLSGIFAVMLTAPWNSILDHFIFQGGIFSGLLIISAGALINALIIYIIVNFVVRWLISK